MLTARERVEKVLRGGHADKVPFTVYSTMTPQCTAMREMRNRGLCIVERKINVFKAHTPNVRIKEEGYFENGKKYIRTYYETPVGTLSTLKEMDGRMSWTHEKMYKKPEDYKVIEFIIKDQVLTENYEAVIKAQKAFGDDAIFRAGIGLEPFQILVSGGYLGMQDFCIEWMDHRDELLNLYEAIVEKRREEYKLVAESPVLHVNYGGNVSIQIIGLENYEKYYPQHYNEAAEIMHKHGKLIGSHYDDNCKLLSKILGETDLDYIEAFTPAPDTDMSLGEARKAWPDKVLWLNFPSSVHLQDDQAVEQKTVDMLNEVDSIDGIIMGITENIPENRWRDSCRAIMDGLDRHAKENPEKYS